MNTSFYNGINGIKTHQFGIDVWSNNIANIELNGFKSSNPEFSTVFSTTLSDSYFNPTSNDISLGSKPQTTALDLRQGPIETTDNTFDLALDAEGWFGLKTPKNQVFYTRAGSYKIDKDGDLLDPNGFHLLGTSGDNISSSKLSQSMLDALGKSYTKDGIEQATIDTIKDINDITLGSVDSQTKINLPNNLYYPATPTTNIKIRANLDPTIQKDALGDEIANVEHFTSSIFTSDGEKKILDMTFTKEVPQSTKGNTWDGKVELLSFYENYDDAKTYDTTKYKIYNSTNKVYTIEDAKDAKIEFSSDGKMSSYDMPTILNGDTPLNIDIGKVGSYDGFTSITDLGSLKNISTDGLEYGLLNGYSVENNGDIIAQFSNGKRVPVAKVAVYHFVNDQGLDRASATLLSESSNSGKAFFYTDKDGNNFNETPIYSNSLEQSNTEMSTALTELILMQKAFDANAKSITTSDQMIQNAINMKK